MNLYSKFRVLLISSSFGFPIFESLTVSSITSIHLVLYASLLFICLFMVIRFGNLALLTIWNLFAILLASYFLVIGMTAYLQDSLARSCWSMFLIASLILLSSMVSNREYQLNLHLERKIFDFWLIFFSLFYILTFLFSKNEIWNTLDSFVIGRIQPLCIALLVLGFKVKKMRYLSCGVALWLCTFINYQAASNLIGIFVVILILVSIRYKSVSVITLLLTPLIYSVTILNGTFQRIYFLAYNSGYDNSIIRYRLLEEPLQRLKHSLLFGTRMSEPLHTTDFLEGRDVPFHNDFIAFSYATGLLGWGLILLLTFHLVTSGARNGSQFDIFSQERIFAYSLYVATSYYGIFNPMFGTFTFIFTYLMIALIPRYHANESSKI
jgi:hypothetical protein